jgi:hypothetical protein
VRTQLVDDLLGQAVRTQLVDGLLADLLQDARFLGVHVMSIISFRLIGIQLPEK